MRKEASDLLDHIEDFIKHYPQQIPSILWSRKGPITNYGFLLVARPENVQTNNIVVFVNKARDRLTEGIDRLYIWGVKDNDSFTRKVANAIKNQVSEYKIIEEFELVNDYRGQPGGLGILLSR